MADSLKEAPARAPEDGDLDSLVVQSPLGVGVGVGLGVARVDGVAADDETIDLRALAKLSSAAPRPLSDPPFAAGREFVRERDLELARDGDVDSVPMRGVSRVTRLRFVAPLSLGFGLGLACGALLFARSDPAAAPRATEVIREAQAAPVPSAPVLAQAPFDLEAHAPAPAALPSPVAAPAPSPQPDAVAQPLARAPAASAARVAASPPVASQAPAPRDSWRAPQTAPAVDAPVVVVTQRSEPTLASAGTPLTAAARPPAPTTPSSSLEAAVPATSRNVDAMLAQALAATDSQRAKAAGLPVNQAVPPTPSREQVSGAMAVMLPAIRGCAMGQSGLATAAIVVQNDGRVASVAVTGAPFQGTASGRCMEGVVRRARFPRFSQPSFRVQFPFAIQ